MVKPLALWSGDLALDEVFWTWTAMVGLLVNVATSILFLVLILQTGRFSSKGSCTMLLESSGLPWP